MNELPQPEKARLSKIKILDPQPHAFHQPQAPAIKESSHEQSNRLGNCGEQFLHLGRGKHHREVPRFFRPGKLTDLPRYHPQHLFNEEDQRVNA